MDISNDIKIYTNNNIAGSTRWGMGYIIFLPEKGSNFATLDHELFHIKDGHVEQREWIKENLGEIPSRLAYLYYFEPKRRFILS